MNEQDYRDNLFIIKFKDKDGTYHYVDASDFDQFDEAMSRATQENWCIIFD